MAGISNSPGTRAMVFNSRVVPIHIIASFIPDRLMPDGTGVVE
jgi:hypothetical protein